MSTPFSHFSLKINKISPLETKFTEVLSSIALKPKTLYFYGKIPKNMSKTVAIVGSRHNTKYGEEVAYKLAYELAKHDVIIISGLAYGIDSIAHRGCLDAGGRTVAVLGTPIDKVYPRAHESLAREIVEKDGAIFSEYGPGEDCYPNTNAFLRRNRIISGLSDVVVIVEAAEKSGSLNTATHTLNQGKEVFAVPGNINNPYSKGCNNLIKQGAFPYTEPDDLIKLLFPEEYLKKHKKLREKNLIGDSDVETLILQALGKGLRSGEEIMNETHLPPELFNEVTIILEIKSRIRALGMNRWALI